MSLILFTTSSDNLSSAGNLREYDLPRNYIKSSRFHFLGFLYLFLFATMYSIIKSPTLRFGAHRQFWYLTMHEKYGQTFLNRSIAPLSHALKTVGKSYMPSDDKVLSTNLVLMESNLVFGPIFPDSANVKYFSKLSKDQADRGSLKRRNIHHSHLGHHIRTVQHASKHNCINSI